MNKTLPRVAQRRSPLSLSYSDRLMLERVQRAHFQHFVEFMDPNTGLVLDRSRASSPASIAATGFALTAYPVAAERGWIRRQDAAAYALKVLRTLWHAPQGPETDGTSGFHGFFYHFLDPSTGLRSAPPKFWKCEISSIDTALLMAGVLFARSYFAGDSADELEIRSLADQLYRRVEWDWLLRDTGLIGHGWTPETGMIEYEYRGLNEAMLLYLLALGSPTHAIPARSWTAFIGDSKAETYYDQSFVRCPGSPMFVYQYPHVWVDFRGIADDVNRRLGFDYFENSRRATIAQHRYARHNPLGWKGYDNYTWGLTASDGPMVSDLAATHHEQSPQFLGYSERGAPGGTDDGTIAPTAALGSLPFAPGIVLKTLKRWLRDRPEIFGPRGFFDAFNASFDNTTPSGWVDPDTISIDQGPILLMLENYQSGLVWETMKNEPYLRAGLAQAGFSGGWLASLKGNLK
jgi:hypothetical protein